MNEVIVKDYNNSKTDIRLLNLNRPVGMRCGYSLPSMRRFNALRRLSGRLPTGRLPAKLISSMPEALHEIHQNGLLHPVKILLIFLCGTYLEFVSLL